MSKVTWQVKNIVIRYFWSVGVKFHNSCLKFRVQIPWLIPWRKCGHRFDVSFIVPELGGTKNCQIWPIVYFSWILSNFIKQKTRDHLLDERNLNIPLDLNLTFKWPCNNEKQILRQNAFCGLRIRVRIFKFKTTRCILVFYKVLSKFLRSRS